MAAAAPRSVGEVDGFITMLRTACSDAEIYSRLEKVLSMPDRKRKAVVHSWVSDLLIAQAPRDLIQAIACLLDDKVAEKSYEVIFRCERDFRTRKPLDGALLLACSCCALALAALFLWTSVAFLGKSTAGVTEVIVFNVLGWLATAAFFFAYRRSHPVEAPAWAALVCALVGFGTLSIALYASHMQGDQCGKGIEAFQQGEYAQSAREHTLCLLVLPLPGKARADTLAQRALSRSEIADYSGAIADWEKSFAQTPKPTKGHLLAHAYALRKSGRNAEAERVLSRAAALPDVWTTEAITLYHRGRYEIARRNYSQGIAVMGQVLALRPDAVMAHWSRGLAYEASGDVDRAAREFEETAFWYQRRKLNYSGTPEGHQVLDALRGRLKKHGLSERYPL